MVTEREARDAFLRHVRTLIDVWERETLATTPRAKLEGLAFSLLTALDGCAASLPPYQLIPGVPVNGGQAWDWRGQPDIAGCLHEEFARGTAARFWPQENSRPIISVNCTGQSVRISKNCCPV